MWLTYFFGRNFFFTRYVGVIGDTEKNREELLCWQLFPEEVDVRPDTTLEHFLNVGEVSRFRRFDRVKSRKDRVIEMAVHGIRSEHELAVTDKLRTV